MKPLDFQHVLKSLAHLSHWQRERLLQVLSQPAEGLAAGQIEACFELAPQCPHCAHERVHRYGRSEGLQRYRCCACGKTFNALTGTPLARLRHKAKWLDFLQAMQDSLTVRRSARDVGVHRNTSFRWRHRFLAWGKNDRPEHLHGITEVDETYFLESSKGARRLGRSARKRGGSATKRGISDEQICVLVARDRTGQTLDFVTGKGPVSKAQLRECLPPVLDPDALLVSDANARYHYFAKDAGISHEAVNLSAGARVKGAFHVQNVNAYHSRLRQWIERFHGVATHYLPNYLGWRRALDTHRLDTPAKMLLAAVGVFPQATVT
jgi:transposase-like protein